MTLRRIASIVSIVLAIAAAGVVLILCIGFWPPDAPWLMTQILIGLPALVLGLLVSRQPGSGVVGPLLSLAGLVTLLSAGSDTVLSVATGSGASWSSTLARASSGLWMLLYLPFALLMLVFPTGRLVSGRWRIVAFGLPVVVLSFAVLAALGPDPTAASPDPISGTEIAAATLLPVFLALLISCAVSMVIRYRTSTGKVRIQLRWLALAGATIPFTLLSCWASYLFLGGPDAVILGIIAMYVVIPLAVAVAVFRHDLYDVDRAIVATAAYLVVITGILLVVAAASTIAGLLASKFSTLIAVLVTAATVLVLGPGRRAAERWVGRRLYPTRERALRAIEELLVRVHAGGAPPEDLQSVLRSALRDPGLQVGYLSPGGDEWSGADGSPVIHRVNATAITLSDRAIGLIVPGDPADVRPSRDIADAAALLAEMVRLRLELAQALAEVAGSRERLLRASYAERRRLEQDLHDGAQQRLVSLGMGLRLAQRHLDDPTMNLRGMLDEAVAEIGTAVGELRQIAHGLRPSALDDGLAAALTNVSRRSAIPVDLTVDVEVLPDLISTTAFYVANEALTNAVKYSEADRVGVSVRSVDGMVNVTVSDNGLGGAEIRPGSGLAGLHDRVSAVGGGLRVASPPGGGTIIEAVIPCAL